MSNLWDGERDSYDGRSHGAPIALRRGPLKQWCGYVGVPEGHPMHSKSYNDPEADFTVHGGCTFAGAAWFITEPGLKNFWWFGFDCAHFGDLVPEMELATALHGGYRDFRYVKRQCGKLARQLKVLNSSFSSVHKELKIVVEAESDLEGIDAMIQIIQKGSK